MQQDLLLGQALAAVLPLELGGRVEGGQHSEDLRQTKTARQHDQVREAVCSSESKCKAQLVSRLARLHVAKQDTFHPAAAAPSLLLPLALLQRGRQLTQSGEEKSRFPPRATPIKNTQTHT